MKQTLEQNRKFKKENALLEQLLNQTKMILEEKECEKVRSPAGFFV
jgi:hypothetical protein